MLAGPAGGYLHTQRQFGGLGSGLYQGAKWAASICVILRQDRVNKQFPCFAASRPPSPRRRPTLDTGRTGSKLPPGRDRLNLERRPRLTGPQT